MPSTPVSEIYPYSPEGWGALDFGDPPDVSSTSQPPRDQLITDVLRIAGVNGSSWPPQARYRDTGHTIEEEVEISERSGPGPSLDAKNALLIGCVAATNEVEQSSLSGVSSWGVMRHLGMLNALGATIVAGLELSPEALETAARVHLRACSKSNSTTFPNMQN